MAKIKQFNILHFNKVKKMLSDIFPQEKISLIRTLTGCPADIIQPLLPLALRKTPESYIAINEDNEVKAVITLDAAKGNRRKWYIKRLFLDKNSFTEGKQLIDFSVAKYGALGADTFCVLIDENDETSQSIFSKMCGFRLCSREILWKMNNFEICSTTYSQDNFEKLKITESSKIASFYNDCISPHFRFSLEKDAAEFISQCNHIFICRQSISKIFLKDKSENIFAYAEVQLSGNNDRIIDLIVAKPYEEEYLPILQSIVNCLKNKVSNIYVLNRNYMSCAKTYEDILTANDFEKIQSKILLVKDFYKPIKNNENIVNPALIFKEISGKPAFLNPESLQK